MLVSYQKRTSNKQRYETFNLCNIFNDFPSSFHIMLIFIPHGRKLGFTE